MLKYFTQINRQFVDAGTKSSSSHRGIDFVDLIAGSVASEWELPEYPTKRTLVIIPDTADPTNIWTKCQSAIDNCTVIAAKTFDVTVFQDVACLTLEDLANQIVHGHDAYRQLASRLHTRIDIDWSPIKSTSRACSSGDAASGNLAASYATANSKDGWIDGVSRRSYVTAASSRRFCDNGSQSRFCCHQLRIRRIQLNQIYGRGLTDRLIDSNISSALTVLETSFPCGSIKT